MNAKMRKSVYMNEEENQMLKNVAKTLHLPESVVVKHLVSEKHAELVKEGRIKL